MKKRNLKILFFAAMAAWAFFSPLRTRLVEAATIRADAPVNIRAGADAATAKLGSVGKGQTLDVTGTANGWYEVLWNGQTAYTKMDYWTGNTVTSLDSVNLRQAADPYAPLLDKVPAGTEVMVLGHCGDWLYLEYNGATGFSSRKYWDVTDEFINHLPFIIGDMDQLNLTPESVQAPVEEAESAADPYRVIAPIPGYATSADARAGVAVVKTVPSGTFFIHKVVNGMYNLSPDPAKSGVWIDPAMNTGRRRPSNQAGADTHAPDHPWQTGEAFTLYNEVPGYTNSADAKAGADASASVPAGKYVVFRAANGMVNLSTTLDKAGVWIDPSTNKQPAQPPVPVSPPSSVAAPQIPPDGEAARVPLGDRVVAEAEKLLGAPYIYGAESWEEGGFDCSGLTQFVYSQVGIEIPRTASWQWAGVRRKVTIPRPGDIIAFAKVEEGGVYHVGIYIGDNKMIHAPKPGAQVKISSLDWYYRNGWVQGFLRPYKEPTP